VRLSDMEDWLTPAEAGRLVGISKQAIIKHLEERGIRAVKTHQGWLVDPKDVERFGRERKERSRT
jgi:excisionase family DNA binding protein